MKANELRIGNLVNVENSQYILSSGDIYNLDQYNSRYGHLYKPIPLTEEWLLKFGFVKYDQMGDFIFFYLKYLSGRRWSLMLSKSDCLVRFYENTQWDEAIKIKFVHQLQNLYFALTGTELESQSLN